MKYKDAEPFGVMVLSDEEIENMNWGKAEDIYLIKFKKETARFIKKVKPLCSMKHYDKDLPWSDKEDEELGKFRKIVTEYILEMYPFCEVDKFEDNFEKVHLTNENNYLKDLNELLTEGNQTTATILRQLLNDQPKEDNSNTVAVYKGLFEDLALYVEHGIVGKDLKAYLGS